MGNLAPIWHPSYSAHLVANLMLAASGGIRNQTAAPRQSPSGSLDTIVGMYVFLYPYATDSASPGPYDSCP
jgi:hypothetical protein